MNKLIEFIKANKIGNHKKNILLSNYTTYKIGGLAKLIVYPKNQKKLIMLIKKLKEDNIKYKIIGNGSNLVFSDNLFDGVLINLKEFDKIVVNGNTVRVGAGVNLMKLAYYISFKGLTGLEFATGIPGTVGGAIYMNAGAYKSDMGFIVAEVDLLTPDYEIIKMYNKDLNFKYRSSFVQKNKDYICLEVKLILKKGDKKEIKELIESRKQRRQLSQPLEYPSAGSVFRNPEDKYAGELIESAGLKGYKIGGAEVSKKHANFIINKKNAKAGDVYKLINYVKDKVKEKYNIELKVEQEFVNWE
ncbi:MAG TPA: UDP-N-acetylmuramate dehydrogenase [Bacilli bacterium]|nr:UDP-N-acetylmuramate dehydrogenase [Bacilli bacterium]